MWLPGGIVLNKKLLQLLSLNQIFAEKENHLKYKIIYLNSVFLLAAVVAFGMGFYRWQVNPLLGAIDFGFVLVAVALLTYLKHHRDKVEVISNIALTLSFSLFYAIYLLAPYQTNRLSLFFLLAAAAIFLKGLRSGVRWLIFIIVSIVAAHFIPAIHTGYSGIDLLTTSLYLIALFLIFWNYETFKQDQFEREQEYKLQSLIDERWRVALESAGDAIWDLNLQTNRFVISKSYAEMLGYLESDFGDTPDHLERILHPDEKQQAKEYLQSFLNGDFNGQYISEHRLQCKDGSYKWILCRGRVTERDVSGRPIHMFGTHVDVTERNQAREEILRSHQTLDDERSLFQTILDNAPLGIWMLDVNGRLRFVNNGFCNATGISEERFLSAQHYSDVLPPAVTDSCKQSDHECFKQEAPHLSSEWIPFVDGREHLLEITKVRLLNKDGSVRGLIGLAVDVTERKEHEKKLQHIAHYDALTGVPNRVLLADRLSQALARAKRDQGLMAVCYLDLDGFKPVNDNFGHDVGDKVLVEITRRIKEAIREDDTVARLGGDEFVVLLVGMQVPEECAGSLNRLLEVIHQPIEIKRQSIRISASIGVALYPEDDHDPDTLLRHADQAMYVAKQSGKNRYHLFDATNDQRTRLHHELLLQIRKGLAQGEFELYYQPKVELITRRMVGAEALLRWNHPSRGLLLPGEFLRVIEETEIEIELGDWVISKAIEQQRRWREQGMQFELSINVSAYHLQSRNFSAKLKVAADLCYPVDCAGTLQIEVLETAALEDVAGVSAIIAECKAFGMSFALDDFGTGYSSMSYLSKFDVDVLKIDQSFIRDMLQDKGDHAIVQGIIALAKAFEMGIVAEGVETEAQFQALLQMGCEVGQGYGIARPMTADALLAWSQ
jgi:diguanylate cyclase (GGDEF)-like protein/PAS domain S-box-containing protein